ncbi:hypothetical protein [Candidatus Xianfuyuplasma coldseepsis]|uniref:HD-GYP domain-containing protein n=1 Tax=Candidatus Xianfuyuplasma coldseepsis TaxID=2782163 RepID=A0A7L7KPZ3_9MOLU|nr:hypothetical protein [Xianfuyuplasma coldseepsis]QMS84332.1 hypothetical protein G4Z02_00770 [Xianfuyuplasma coldseepsis]
MAKDYKRLDDFFQKPTSEPEELKKYYEDLNKGIDPNKLTVTDKVAIFFRNLVSRVEILYKKEKPKTEVVEKPSGLRHKIKVYYRFVVQKFIELFNFEADVDILDNTSVLFQRNKVNRRILFIINAIFILFFGFIGNQRPNYIVIAAFAVLMLIISRTLRKIINEKPRTLLKQQMAMYIGSVYILMASIGVYIKLRWSAGNVVIGDLVQLGNDARITTYITDISISQAGYLLIYFSLIVISLYQDATLLRILFRWVFGFMFIVHILIMYPLYDHAASFQELYDYLFVTNVNITIDIVLRTVTLVVFYIALYSSVSIGQMMNNKRKEEMIKRREMEQDFTAVVGDVFDVISVFNSHTINQNKADVHRVAEMASRLANILGLSSRVCSEIYNYSVIHIDRVTDLSILQYEGKDTLTEKDYGVIREKTVLGSVVIKRLQLNQKSEDIVRMHFEKTVDPNLVEKMKRIQRSQEGQIILLAEIYDILRQERNYKSELKHKRAIDLLQLEFKEYFEPYILDRFLKYQMEFEAFYEKYKYSELGEAE